MQYQPLVKITTTQQEEAQKSETKPHITLVTDTKHHNSNKLRLQQPTITNVSPSSAATTGRKVMTNLSSTSISQHQQHHYHHDSTVPSPPPPPPMIQAQHQHHHHSSASAIERVSCKMPRSLTTTGCYDMENIKPNLSPDTNSYLGKSFFNNINFDFQCGSRHTAF